MTTLDQRLFSGARAKEVLDNEEFSAAFDAIEQEVINTWTNSPARDSVGREKCWQYLMLLRKVKTNLQTTLETGKLAQLELAHQRTMLDRARDAFSGTWRE